MPVPVGHIVHGTPEATIDLQAVAAESTLCPAQPGQAHECSSCCLMICLACRHMARRQVVKSFVMVNITQRKKRSKVESFGAYSNTEDDGPSEEFGLRGYAAQRTSDLDARSAVRPPTS
jgi:hypothetical protein